MCTVLLQTLQAGAMVHTSHFITD